MKYLILLIISSCSLYAAAQDTEMDNDNALAQANVAEGKLLYASEKASWHGTDLFLARSKNPDRRGGYFSYTEGKNAHCIFYSKDAAPQVIADIVFDEKFDTKTALVNLEERPFSSLEKEYYDLRQVAAEEIENDTLFKSYKNTQFNLAMLITPKENRVYLLTGTSAKGVVLFGNDYLLRFEKNRKLIEKKSLHRNLIVTNYGKEKNDVVITSAIHTHAVSTGIFITPTDVCTLMLYKDLHKWSSHFVFTEKYVNIWSCDTDELTLMRREAFDKIYKNTSKD